MLMLICVVFIVVVQMNTVLEKLSSSARELSYYHSGEGGPWDCLFFILP